jgi:hypothetical protein
LAAAVAVAPQMLRGNSCGHDFDFHLVSWFDCLNGWRHGIVYPHWATSANFGAGEPRFVFYPPLTWMVGAALGLVLPWQFAPIALTFLLLAGTGLGTRALARQALDDGAATLAGCAALFSGYALFCAYERTAFGELAGGFWIPLLLLYALPPRQASIQPLTPDGENQPGFVASHPFRKERGMDGAPGFESARKDQNPPGFLASHPFAKGAKGWGTGLALVVAGCWLSNLPLGVMGCYLLAAVALAGAVLGRSWTPVLRAGMGATLGTALAGLYLLPAAWEQRWVDVRQATDDPGERIENSWLFARHADPALADHDTVLFTASIIAATMLAVALCGVVICWWKWRLAAQPDSAVAEKDKPVAMDWRWWVLLGLIPVAVLFLQFPVSLAVWNLLPKLRFLQFPWRWLVVLEAPMAIFFAGAVWPGEVNQKPGRRRMRVGVAAVCAVFFLAATVYAGRTFFQSCDDEDNVSAMAGVYYRGAGFSGASEYAPPGADNMLVARGLPEVCLASDPAVVLGAAPGEEDAEDAVPVWNAGQGSCEATLRWQLDQPEHKRLSTTIGYRGPLIPLSLKSGAAVPSLPSFLILRLRSYLAWRVAVNGYPAASLPRRDDGLIVVPVWPGRIVLTVDWTTTADVLAGRWLSALAVLALTGLWLWERRLSQARL